MASWLENATGKGARTRHHVERIEHAQMMRGGNSKQPETPDLMSRFKGALLFKAKHYTTKVAPRILFAVAATAVIAGAVNQVTKNENGNGYFQPQVDDATSAASFVINQFRP